MWSGLGPGSNLKRAVLGQNVSLSGGGEVENIKKGQWHPGLCTLSQNLGG